MINVIAVAALLAVVGCAAGYVIRAKKRGQHCIGCPHAKTCPSSQKGGCNCQDH